VLAEQTEDILRHWKVPEASRDNHRERQLLDCRQQCWRKAAGHDAPYLDVLRSHEWTPIQRCASEQNAAMTGRIDRACLQWLARMISYTLEHANTLLPGAPRALDQGTCGLNGDDTIVPDTLDSPWNVGVELEWRGLSLNEHPASPGGGHDPVDGRFDRAPDQATSLRDDVPAMHRIAQVDLQIILGI
jgi:hypothetical protein